MGKKRLMIGVAITGATIGLTPTALETLGWVGPLQPYAWVVVALTALGMLLKLYIGDIATNGDFLFHKYGYDNCIVTFGGTLTAVSLQLQSEADLFPGLSGVPGLGAVPSGELRLFILCVGALLACLHTAHIAGDIKKHERRDRGFWAMLNAFIGVVMLATFVLILISK